MRLRLVTVSPRTGSGPRLTAEPDADLSVIFFEDIDTRELFAEAMFASMGGPLPTRRSPMHHNNSRPVFGLRRPRAVPTDDGDRARYATSYVNYETGDGRSLGVLTDLVVGGASVVDLDTNHRVDFDTAPVPGGFPFDVFESLSRIKAPDAQLASQSPDQALKALRKVALSGGMANLVPDLVARVVDVLSGDPSRHWSPPIPSIGPTRRLHALERNTDECARAARRRDHELQSLHAARRRKEAALEDLYEERSLNEYLLLRVRHKRISQRVGRIDDLTAQLERLRSEPAPPGAETAMALAPRVEKLMAALGEARAELGDLLRAVPADRRDIDRLERELIKVQEELSLLAGAPPVGEEIEAVVARVYEEWRRLSAEAEAADFAAAQARTDAEELSRESADSIVRLSRVTTAEKLRSRLRARTAVAHEHEAASRKRRDVLDSVRAELAERGSSLAETISKARLVRTPIEWLAEIEDAHRSAQEAIKTARLIPRYRFLKRRRAQKVAACSTARERWLLAEVGIDSYESLSVEIQEACEAYRLLEPLSSATYEVASMAARLVEAEEDLSAHADGVEPSDLPTMVDELEAHQNRIAAAIEIQREADVATEAARSLKAARDAAATELLARLRPLGITEGDPAMAWSRFRVLAEGWRKKKALDERLAELTSELEPYVELRMKLDGCRQRQDDLARRLYAVLSQIDGCDSGSLEERIAGFARLRDAALLEKKLSTARSHLESQLDEVCKGRPAEEWRKELLEVEARLSELEESHPSWKSIEVASPDTVLEERVAGLEVKIRAAETALASIEAEMRRLDSESQADSFDHRSRLFEIRSRLERLDSLAKVCSSLRIDEGRLYVEGALAQTAEVRLAAVAGGSSRASMSAPFDPRIARHGDGGYHHDARQGSPAASSFESSLSAYLLARTAMLVGCGPEEEQLPLIVDGALDAAAPYEKRDILRTLALASAATQVLVLTTDPDVRALAEAWGARVEIPG